MTARYVIEGNLAVRETITRSEAVPLDDMLENLTAYQPLELYPTPHNMRSLSVKPRPNMQLQAQILIGHDPMTRRITHKNCPASSVRRDPKSYQLHFPYGLFWFALHGNKLNGPTGESIVWNPQGWGYVWMKEPFRNLDQECFTPMMPNIFGDSRICFGANSVNGSLPVGSFIDESINTFWTSEFNQDLDIRWPYDTLEDWEAASANDWQNWNLLHGETLAKKFGRFEEDMQWDKPVPSSTEDTIQPLPMYHTFDNIETWISALLPQHRERLLATIDMIREDTDE